ncbi:MAG: 7,8-didemethyl-8-hydroxy-5-deazariboflavin synthase subunit CofG [Coleofasciculaceae cyanobacterium SM2_3_26]|nr:7,8-didemethyl-8-hydroxy-5-deazariboflavin synthase subunit CofG [Coleofasciculaceae cyanobacterium SM2_3_26]
MTRIVTYSPAYTIVPTYECFNRCSYCNFRTDPGQSPWMTLAEARRILTSLQGSGVIEILILSGEVHPKSDRRGSWFQRIYDLCRLALDMGFLPHTNAGPLSYEEMARLKQVNTSMGLMLEQQTPKLLDTVHKHAPSKQPDLRLQQLTWAGELRIPFTTGILLGIGETPADWEESLEAIARCHQQWGHIQEVILQPHSPGDRQVWQGSGFDLRSLPEVVALAREILPPDITLQIPPNLVDDPQWLLACLEAGARDLGGISPRDEVNPDYPHPSDRTLDVMLTTYQWQLTPRLPLYPQYDEWLEGDVRQAVRQQRLKLWQEKALK